MEKELVYVVYISKGAKVGEYIEVPEDFTTEEFVGALQHLDETVGVYHGATNLGPIDPYWER